MDSLCIVFLFKKEGLKQKEKAKYKAGRERETAISLSLSLSGERGRLFRSYTDAIHYTGRRCTRLDWTAGALEVLAGRRI
jgi:hypothetical protein